MSGGRLRALGFRHRVSFADGLANTVRWYLENEDWWRPVRSGAWNDYYARQYADRLATSTAAD
jgi:dTDP-glucose 4,6-dehydratase